MAPRLMTALTAACLLVAFTAALPQQPQQPQQQQAPAAPLAETPRVTLEDVDFPTEMREDPNSEIEPETPEQATELTRQRRTFGSFYIHKGYGYHGYYPRYYHSYPRYYSYYRPHYSRYYW